MPNPDYFPFSQISAKALVHDSFATGSEREASAFSWLWRLFPGSNPKERVTNLTINKYSDDPNDVILAKALQYGMF
jgi:hypothetical protein